MEMGGFVLGEKKKNGVFPPPLHPQSVLSQFMKILLLLLSPSQLMDPNSHAYEGYELPA